MATNRSGPGSTGAAAGVGAYLPLLVQSWARDEPDARHRVLDATLVFLDVSGFTKLSERLARLGPLGAEELTLHLNRIFGRFLGVAAAEGGDLLKFGGDALLLLFAGDRHPARAAAAARAMRRELLELGRLESSAGRFVLRMSVGAESGPLHCFLVGEDHRELIVTGPVVSTAVAMEHAARSGQVIAGPGLAARLDAAELGRAIEGGRLLRAAGSAEPDAAPPVAAPSRRAAADLTPFIPAALRGELGAGTAGEHRTVTNVFVRFGGLDEALAHEDPAAVTERIASLVARTERAATRHGVTFLSSDIDVDGGKLILVAGAPRTAGDDEERALRVGREIVEGGDELPLQVGVHRGRVFVGDVGADFRRVYTVMGDAVNVAARVMAHARPGQVLTTRDVVDRTARFFEFAALPAFAAKGKARPIVPYRVRALRARPAVAVREDLPLIGREREMADLLGRWQAAQSGHGGLVEIEGEAGIGKSRLVEALVAAVAPAAVHATRCDQYEASTPYFVFRRLLRGLLDIGEDATEQGAGAALARWVRASAPDLVPWLPLLAIPFGATARPTAAVTALDASSRVGRLHRVVDEFLDRRLDGDALIAIEDVHWMDDASSDLLHSLLGHLRRRCWLVCVTRRPLTSGFRLDESEPGVTAQRMDLGPLEAGAGRSLADAVGIQMTRAHAASLVDRSAGNPLYLLELIEVIGDRDQSDALPDSVEVLVASRIDQLAPEDRRVLRDAAVLGVRFRTGLLLRAVEGDYHDLSARTLQRLAGLVEPAERGWLRFRHGLVRDVAYAGLAFQRRREVHARVGRLIEEGVAGDPAGQAELLSFHFDAAQVYDKAWHYSVLAADGARAKYAHLDAARFYRRALDAAARLERVNARERRRLAESMGDAYETAARYDDASDAYCEAQGLAATDAPALARIRRKQGDLRERAGAFSQALRWYRRGLSLVDGPDAGGTASHRVIAELSLAYAGTRYRQGRLEDCIRWGERAIAEARRARARATLAHAYYIVDNALRDLGRPPAHRERSLAIFREIGDLVAEAKVLNNMCVDALANSDWAHALDAGRRARDAATRAGDVITAATAANNMAEIESDQGKLDDAIAGFEQALASWDEAGYRLGAALATSNLGRALVRAGRFDEGERRLHRARDTFESLGVGALALECTARLAEAHLARGDLDTARRLAEDTLARLPRSGGPAPLRTLLKRTRGAALLAAGRRADAARALRDAVDEARRDGLLYELGLGLTTLADAVDGEPDARAARTEGEAILRRLGAARPAAQPA